MKSPLPPHLPIIQAINNLPILPIWKKGYFKKVLSGNFQSREPKEKRRKRDKLIFGRDI
jgi:hypothetical protein